jgi:hypothetical protein
MYRFNKYSWIVALVYIAIIVTIECHSYLVPWQGLYLTSPIIFIFILWSERITPILKKDERAINKTESFNRDLFLINFSFILEELLSFPVQYNNPDAGWWPLVFWFITLFGFLFAFAFSLIALMIDSHKRYTFIFSILIILLIPPLSFLAYAMPFPIFANHYFFYVVTGSLLGLHLTLALGYRIIRCRE